MLRDTAIFVWRFWLYGLSCFLSGFAIGLTLPAIGLMYLAEWVDDIAAALAHQSNEEWL